MDEYEQSLTEILDIAKKEKVDCLLVAGDIFDSHAPNAEAEKLVYGFFSELAGNKIPAIVITGNHDHPRRFEALQPLLERLRIQLRCLVAPAEEGGILNFAAGREKARIAVLPWVPEHKLLDASLMMGSQADRSASYADQMTGMLGSLTSNFEAGSVNLIIGHVYVHGAEPSGSERAIHVTKPYAMTAQSFPGSAAYVALGHLHRPQLVDAPCPIRYCGSLLQLDFGEQGQKKEVVLIDASAGKTARVTPIALSSGRMLRTVKGTVEELQKDASELNNGDYLRVAVQLPKHRPGIADQIHELLPWAVDVKLELPEKNTEQAPSTDFRVMTPAALFEKFCAERDGPPDEALMHAFLKLYTENQDASS